ncbi:CPBP family glutamic-type intramembrane protease [Actinomadura formosensis]|uniref:CPBP family glutamic-type intramembrane protease n=1 Tax=Actinomadura formosensis TaxID=60706 RepID=UPI003D8BF8E6
MSQPGNPPHGWRLTVRVLGVLAVLFGPHAVYSVAQCIELAGVDVRLPGLPGNSSAPGVIAAGVWLLVRARSRHDIAPAWCAAGLVLAALVLLPHDGGAAEAVAVVLLTVAGTWLSAVVGKDTGVRLWARWGGLSRDSAVQAAVAFGLVVAGHTASRLLGDQMSRLPGADGAASDDSVLQFGVTALVAGAREEIPMLALVAALMAAARRPTWQILAAVCVIRVLPHLYYGISGLATLVFAGVSLWAYQVSGRRIGPIIAGHTAYNLLLVFGGLYGEQALAVFASCGFVVALAYPNTLRAPSTPSTPPASSTSADPVRTPVR